jgi:hypothetical protein
VKPPLAALPAREAPVAPLDVLTWPADREPDFVAWLRYAQDKALVSWVRDRLVAPKPHVVYVLQCAVPDTFYVGITSDLADRMKSHGRAARRRLVNTIDRRGADDEGALDFVLGRPAAWPSSPGESWILQYGLARVDDRERAVPDYVIEVPDKVVALLVEALVSCSIRGAGHEVFGCTTDAICPGADWLAPKSSTWDRNALRPRTMTAWDPQPLPRRLDDPAPLLALAAP